MMGCSEDEVTVMNTLTVNLHLIMQSFYRPDKQRYRILMEAGAFPSDQYALETLVRLHGFDADDAVIEVHPREGRSYCILKIFWPLFTATAIHLRWC